MTLGPRIVHVAVWLAVVAVVCGLARGSPECYDDGNLDESSCFETSTSAICSGNGICSCGQCVCNERENFYEVISGAFCECTNFQCYRSNGQLCGGRDHGECMCNKCLCKPGWTGDDCMCEDSRNNCMNPESGEECSNQGECECNQCKCYETASERYSGKYCEDCPTCKGKCLDYKQCVQCQVFQTGELTMEECKSKCNKFNATVINKAIAQEGERMCTFFDENDCRFTFVYSVNEDKMPVVNVQQILECPPQFSLGEKSTAGERSHGSLPNFFSSISVLVAFLFVIPLIG